MNVTPDTPPSDSSASEPQGVTVGVAAFNETLSLEKMVREIAEVVPSAGYRYEITIVDDGSQDGTAELADRLAAINPAVAVIHHPINQGIGPTFHDAIRSGTMPFVTSFAGDGQFPASIIPQFMSLMKDVDLVLGYIPDLEKGRPPLLAFFSWAERLIVRTLFGSFPKFQGIMMIRRSWLNQITLTSKGRGWIIQMEVVLRALRAGARIISAPTAIRPREYGKSRATTLRNILSNVGQIIRLWWDLKFDR